MKNFMIFVFGKELAMTLLAALCELVKEILFYLLVTFFFSLFVNYGVQTGFFTHTQALWITQGAGFLIGFIVLTFVLVCVVQAAFLSDDPPSDKTKG